ncbi:MAG TPA: membrane protein insertase YidC [Terracidiphilus sp.]|nr:membrane protein insertase YidC [Terracidiphilus sp.]
MPEFQNPNLQSSQGPNKGGGGDMSSMMVMVFLAVAIFLGFQYFQKPKPPAPSSAPQTQQQSAPAEPSTAPAPASEAAGPAQSQTSKTSHAAPAPTPAINASSETETTVENAQYRIVFTNRGALVKHWILKDPHYKDSSGAHQLDMVQQEASSRFGFPLSLFTYESALTSQLNSALYQASATGTVQAPNSITFHYAQNGLDVVKTFHFDQSYVITAEVQVRRDGQPVRALLSWPAGLGDMEEFQGRSAIPGLMRTPSYFAWSLAGKQDTLAAGKVSNNATLDGEYQYAATTDLYFTAAFLPDVPERATLVTLHNTIDLPSDPSSPNGDKKPADVIGIAVGDSSGYTRLRLYAGPKQMDLVSSIHSIGPDGQPNGPSLEPLIQFGTWLGVIAKPLFLALRFLYEHGIPNWGWAILILTTIFNLIMLPTRIMMMRSSLKMMRIQPKVDALKRKYQHLKATDPKRAEMNQEMMALYKTEGVNMYGSCLPMLIQMPLFFAYYRVLQNTVELRQAHWTWLHDLSAPDPLHILPALIIITMFVTQFITPSPGMDPNQRRIMAIMMPIIFGFTLWHYASGLALYWCTGNIINLAIQVSINQSHIGKEMHAIAAKRAAKRAGINPKTLQGKR